jgi:hypothetical protein
MVLLLFKTTFFPCYNLAKEYKEKNMTRVEQMFSVVSAQALDGLYVRVYFSMPLDNTSSNASPVNFTFTGTETLAAISVNIVSDYADVRVSRMIDTIAYNVTVQNVRDIFSRKIHSPITATFIGIGIPPRVISVTGITSRKVRVTFSEVMTNDNNLGKASNYTITDGISVLSAQVISSKIVDLTTTTFTTKHEYFLTVENVRDYLSNMVTSTTGKINFVAADRPKLIAYEIVEEPLALRLIFDRTLRITPTFLRASNFAINGPITFHKGTITAVNNSAVDISYDDAQAGAQYHVAVGMAVDEIGRIIDPHYQNLDVVLQGISPNLVSILQTSASTVRIGFDYPIALTSAVTNPSNYSFSSGIVTISATMHNSQIIDLTTSSIPDSTIVHLTVYNLLSTFGNALANNALGFVSYQGAPRVATATALTSPYRIRVKFTQDMMINSALTNVSNYVISGPTSIGVGVAAVVSSKTIDLYYADSRNGGTYTVSVYNVQNTSGVAVSTVYNHASCVLSALVPQIIACNTITTTQLRIVFSKDVLNNTALTTPTNYVISDGITVSLVTRINSTTVDLTTSAFNYSSLYTITISNVGDVQGNLVPATPVGFTTLSGFYIVTAIATTTSNVRVAFSADVSDTNLTDYTNYTFTCPNIPHKRPLVELLLNKNGNQILTSQSMGSYPVFISKDLGDHWGAFYPDSGTMAYGPYVAQSSDGKVILLCAWQRRLYLSTDYGVTFLETQPKGNVDAPWRVPACDADGSVLIAPGALILYISTTGGSSWSAVTTLPGVGVLYNYDTVCSSDGSVIVCDCGSGGPPYLHKIYVSTDTGGSWVDRTPAGYLGGSGSQRNLAVSDDGSCIMHTQQEPTGSSTIRYSANYGVSWITISLPLSGFINTSPALSGNGQIMYVVNRNQNIVYKSSDSGSTWSNVTGTIGERPWRVACDSTGNKVVVATSNYTTAWPNTYVEQGKVYLSNDGGGTWTLKSPPFLVAKGIAKVDTKTIDISTYGIFPAEMTLGTDNYTLTTQNITDSFGTPTASPKTFSGLGTKPLILSCTFVSPSVQINFDSDMPNNSTLKDSTNYVLVGPGIATVTAISCDATATVTHVHAMISGSVSGLYALTINNVTDLASNTIGNSVVFLITIVGPKVLSATALDSTTVEIVFSELMSNTGLTTPGKYVFDGGLIASVVTPIGAGPNYDTVDVTVNEMEEGESYLATISTTLQNMLGIVMDVTALTDIFSGLGVAPQVSSAAQIYGYNRITVIFNEAMNNDAILVDPGNYIITGASSPVVSLVTYVNPTQVALDLGSDLVNGAHTVRVINVVDVAGNVVDAAHDDAIFTGYGKARVSSVTRSGTVLTVVFDQNMDDAGLTTAGNYVLTSDALIQPTVVIAKVNQYTVTATMTGEMKTGTNNYTLTVSNLITLGNGLGVDASYNHGHFSGAGTAPQVSAGAQVYGYANKITVTFNEPMGDIAGSLVAAGNYSITGVSSPAVSSVTYIDPTHVTLNLGSDFGIGLHTVTAINVMDAVGNVIDAAHDDANFLADGVKPQVLSIVFDYNAKDELLLNFNENMEDNAAFVLKDNYVLSEPGLTITVFNVVKISATQVKLELSGDLNVTGIHTVTVDPAVVDLCGLGIDPAHDEGSLDLELTAPQVSSGAQVYGYKDRITVIFNEAMKNDAILIDPGNYAITGSSTPGVDSVTRVDATTVTLILLANLVDGAHTVTVSNVKDLVGNVIDAAHDDANFPTDGTNPQVSSIVFDYNVRDELLLNFSENMEDNAAFIFEDNYVLDEPGHAINVFNVVKISATQVKLELSGDLSATGTHTVTVDPAVVDLYGLGMDPANDEGSLVLDFTPPTVVEIGLEDDTGFYMRFNKAMLNDAELVAKGNYTFTVGGYSVDSVTRLNATNVRIEVLVSIADGDYTIEVEKVSDTFYNEISGSNSASLHVDRVKPQVTDALSVDSTHIDVYFDEVMDSVTATTPGNYVITGVSTPVVSTAVLFAGRYRLTLATPLSDGLHTVTVSNVEDEYSNVIDPAHDDDSFTCDFTKPQVSTAYAYPAADRKQVFIEFNEDMLDNGALIDDENYAVTGASSPLILSVTKINVRKVRLNLDSDLVNGNYTAEVTNAISTITDTAGNIVDTAHDSYLFNFDLQSPHVSAVAVEGGDYTYLRVTFDEAMLNEGYLTDQSNYVITIGMSCPTVQSVNRENATQVVIELFPDIVADDYRLTVSNARDLNQNTIVGYFDFTIT